MPLTSPEKPRRMGSLAHLRPALVRLHRWLGLASAGFLIVAGLTGSLMAWNDEIEAAICPDLFVVEPPFANAPMLDPLVLRERLLALHPGLAVPALPLRAVPGRSTPFAVEARTDARASAGIEVPNDQVFMNPYTGEVLGERKWGDISQGMKNLMPFVYRLHHQLALGVIGNYVFGVVALLWTLDCFVGAYLTLPTCTRKEAAKTQLMSARSWAARWWPAWKVRWASGRYKVKFDLHRASGLWTWLALLVMAWSSVAFNLSEVYGQVMETVFARQPDDADLPTRAQPLPAPTIGYAQARDIGRHLMARQARSMGFEVIEEEGLTLDPTRGVYRYDVRSSRDIRSHGGATSVLLDADTGALKGVWLPTGAAGADTIRTWLTTLHRAALWGAPMKFFICFMGLLVVTLAITGVVIWQRKRGARRSARPTGS